LRAEIGSIGFDALIARNDADRLRLPIAYPAAMRFIVTLFIALIVLSALQPWLQKLGIGRMPGDFRFRIGKREFLLPFTSTLVLTVLMFVIARLI
jgi:hypothetical protein